MLTCLDDYLYAKKIKDINRLISSFIADQGILQSDWIRETIHHNQSKMVVSGATFPWWLSPCKKKLRPLDSFHRYWCSKNPVIWLDERHNWQHWNKRGSLTCYLRLMIISMQKKSKRLIEHFQKYWWSKNPAIWLNKRHNWDTGWFLLEYSSTFWVVGWGGEDLGRGGEFAENKFTLVDCIIE